MLSNRNGKNQNEDKGKPVAGEKLVGLRRAENRPEIGSNGVKGDETQIEKPHETDHDIEPERQRDKDADLDGYFEIVAVNQPSSGNSTSKTTAPKKNFARSLSGA